MPHLRLQYTLLLTHAAECRSSMSAKVGERGGSQSQCMRNARSDLSCALVRDQERVFSARMNAILRMVERRLSVTMLSLCVMALSERAADTCNGGVLIDGVCKNAVGRLS